MIILIGFKIAMANMHNPIQVELSHIALIAALPPILLSATRWQLLKSVDWSTLLFFAAMFVLMASVWQSGFMQQWVKELSVNLASVPAIMIISATLSQLISNEPLVALYLPMLRNPDVQSLMALAVGSTIAGNLSILGAASNIIIIQKAEKRGDTLSLFEFARVGIPLGFLNLLIYWAWFRYMFS